MTSRLLLQVRTWARPLAGLAATAVLAGCASNYPLMPTPLIYRGADAKPLFADVPADRAKSSIDLVFVTDRAPAASPDDPLPYTAERSRSIAYGTVTVNFGQDVSWSDLVKDSTAATRPAPLNLELGATKELGRFPPVIYGIVPAPGGITRAPAVMDAHEKAATGLQQEIARRIATSTRKEVVLYVHGYHNTFKDAAFTMAELCHFLGREFVCAIFTWPAGGSRGLFAGYNVDRESGEFAAEDLKKTIRLIAGAPGVERIHLLAHSRGTDVLSTALAELAIEAFITRGSLVESFKISNVVLLAPDIDADVAAARIFKVVSDPGMPYGTAPIPRGVFPSNSVKLTAYVSPDDKALSVSQALYGSLARLGRVDAAKLTQAQIEQARGVGVMDIITVTEKTDTFGHSYFVSNPAVSSDLIALLRYGLKPGERGRPLIEIVKPFWQVPALSSAAGD